jgi:hypothetical protein
MKTVITGYGRLATGCVLGTLAAHLSWGQQVVVDQIDAPLLQKHHTNLFVNAGESRGFTRGGDEVHPRIPAGQHDAARDYIASAFTAAGLTPEMNPFSFATSFGAGPVYYTNCNNVVATIPGSDPATNGYYIIGAYYDTVDKGQPNPDNYSVPGIINPGADMNGSGVAALLSLAEVLSKYSFRSTLVFVAFDASQKNFTGAKWFLKSKTTAKTNSVTKIPRNLIKGMISIDTIGYHRKGGYKNQVLVYGGKEVPSKNRVKMGKSLVTYGTLDVVQGGTLQSSDHVVFHTAGIDSLVVQEGGVWVNPYTYTKLDSVTTSNYIDYAYMARVTKGVAGFICTRAGVVIP